MKKMKLITATIALGTALLVLGGCASSTPAATPAKEVKVFRGVGQTPVFRVKLDKTTQAKSYNFSYVTASALFDNSGKIIDVYFDTLEVVQTTPTSKAGSPVFSGWPTATVTDETVMKEVASWQTKLERGDVAYGMKWSEQAAVFQKFFKGKTVADIEAWYAKNVSDVNGKPLTEKATDPKDVAKYAKLTDAEKKALAADVTSGASISLKDDHGDFVGALKEAFATKKEITIQ